MKTFSTMLIGLALCSMCAQAKSFVVSSPDGKVRSTVNVGRSVTYDLAFSGQKILNASAVSMQISGGETWGVGSKLVSAKASKHSGVIPAAFYKKTKVRDDYNQLLLRFREFNIVFRAYNEGLAYRFEASRQGKYRIEDERAQLCFAQDFASWIPYSDKSDDPSKHLYPAFESFYDTLRVSQFDKKLLAFLPFVVKADDGVKLVMAESDVEAYPSMFIGKADDGPALISRFAPYSKEVKDYIAQADGPRTFPWRILSLSANDADILGNDMVWRLASPSRLDDVSWIRPGKVAWDWWNNWGVYGVPFRTGINTSTYKYYIDFAARYGIEYVMLDDGWFDRKAADIFKIVPAINLQEIIEYGRERGVGVILWATCGTFGRDMERACSHYAVMGVKGFKIDFINRNDAWGMDYLFRAARTAAKYHLLVDFHGVCPPAGLNRTYPNVLNFEGVKGMENNKWGSLKDNDQVSYATVVPFARMFAGPMDYTQGAMTNALRDTYAPINDRPMGLGTRCGQLAEYVIFLSMLNMLCDSPVNYDANPRCTEFIARVPVVWDETVPLRSSIGEYVAVARRSGQKWFVGAITNWTPRDLELDLTPLKVAGRKAKMYHDGPNADRYGEDWMMDEVVIPANGKLQVHLAPGGGVAVEI